MTMIRSILFVTLLLTVSVFAFGAPFLVSDPYATASGKLTKFLVTINGKTGESIPAMNADGALYLKYDLGGLPDGTYTVTIRAVDIEGKESFPAAYSFKKTGERVEPYIPRVPKQKIPPSRTYPGHSAR